MINLIPPQAKKIVAREYWLRVITIGIFLLSFVLVLTAVMQVPTYVLVTSLEGTYKNQINDAQAERARFKELSSAVEDTNVLINHLSEDDSTKVDFSDYINQLDEIAGQDISITKFNFNSEKDVLNSISLIGKANTRTALANFRSELENSPQYLEADLPISNLAKEKDITFTLTIVLSEPES